ncbi:ABC transporter permease [Tsukamurella sp. NPDC003166]|uniref:ABC transporter permease n=1 Tax=Tsukamurella sp. NPDC003166 TaxID=3154444 RepID=UPI0033B9C979
MTDSTTRAVPPSTGRRQFATWVRLDLRRAARDGRFLAFSVALPVLMFLVFGLRDDVVGYRYPGGNATAYVMISMAVFAAAMSATAAAARIATERWQGWVRQVQVLQPSLHRYVAVRITVAAVQSLAAVVAMFVVGAALGARGDTSMWFLSPLIAWASSAVFAAAGIAIGLRMRSQNAMQIAGPGLALLAAAGGLFVPIDSGPFAVFSQFTPMYGMGALAHLPLTHGDPTVPMINTLGWAAIAAVAALWSARGLDSRAVV